MDEPIDFYFDFVSPYSYLAHQRVPGLADRFGRRLVYKVIDLKEAKRLAGNTGPSTREMPIKLHYARTDMKRWADCYGVPLVPPQSNDPTRLNCGVFYAADRDRIMPYLDWVWHRVWGEGAAMDEALLRRASAAMGWEADDFLGFTLADETRRRYHAATQEAHARKIFGVPTLMIGEEMWWGNDRLHFLEEFLAQAAVKSPGTEGAP